MDEDEGNSDGNRYIPLPPTTLPSLFQKQSNCPSDLSKKNKEPNLPHMHPKKLLAREVLTLRQSSQTKKVQKQKKRIPVG